MKYIKKIFVLLIGIVLLPLMVYAGSISFNTPEKTSPNTYQFTLNVTDIDLNYISGKINITNGSISKITMHSGWINETGINNTFYFYHDGKSTGSYLVATIEVTMTGNSIYNITNLKYGFNQCLQNDYGTYFDENGNIVNKNTFEATCSLSKDATLKSLTLSTGVLSPIFSKELEIYSTNVENEISTITFYPTPSDAKAKVVFGQTCSLKVGVNICKIVVEAESGAQKTYAVTVTRKSKEGSNFLSDATISNLVVHNGVLTEEFVPTKKEYNVKVNDGSSNIYFTFITNSDKTKHTSDICHINSATSSCQLTITAEDGKTKNSYLFYIKQDENHQTLEQNNNPTNNQTKQNTENTFKTKSENISNAEEEITTNVEENSEVENIEERENIDKQGTTKEITLPLLQKEVNTEKFLIVISLIILFLLIIIGVLIIKQKKKKD